jgi:flagellar protein FliT
MASCNHILSLYESVATISGAMLLAARDHDWNLLAELESRYSATIERIKAALPDGPLPDEERLRKVQLIQKILDDDRAIRDITQPWLRELQQLIFNTGTQRKLAQAYGTGQGY